MKQCTECDRHLFGPEPECPFCGASQLTTHAGRAGAGAVASMTLAIGLGLAACGPQVGVDGETSGSGSGTTEAGDSTAAMTVATTTATTTAVGTTTDGTTAASDDVDDSQDDAPCGFYAGCPPEDWGPTAIECDVLAQDCPEGEKCMPWANDGSGSWNATRCSPIGDDPDGVGEPCQVEGSGTSGIDSCELGAMCFDVDPETNEGECVGLCMGTLADPICPDGQSCSITNDGVLTLCFDTCDPLAQDCADPAEGCYASLQGDFMCLPANDPGTDGAACAFINDCTPGSVCLFGAYPGCMDFGCCADFCDLTAPNPCPPMESCTPWYEMPAPVGYQDVGICLP